MGVFTVGGKVRLNPHSRFARPGLLNQIPKEGGVIESIYPSKNIPLGNHHNIVVRFGPPTTKGYSSNVYRFKDLLPLN